MDVCLPQRNSFLIVFHNSSQMKPFMETIHNHLHDLFGANVQYQLRFHECSTLLPMLKNLSHTVISGASGIKEASVLDEYFSMTEQHEYIRLVVPCAVENDGSFKSDSKIYRANTLSIQGSKWVCVNALRYFTGRQAFLYGYLSDYDIIQFMKRWQSNDSYTNLEALFVELWDTIDKLNPENIMDSIDMRLLNEPITEPVLELHKSESWMHLDLGMKLSHRYYIVRDHDKRVATFSFIHDKKFIFTVWDLNEEQFHEKFDFPK